MVSSAGKNTLRMSLKVTTLVIIKIGHVVYLRPRKILCNEFILPQISCHLSVWDIEYKKHYSKLTVSLRADVRALVFAKIRRADLNRITISIVRFLTFSFLCCYVHVRDAAQAGAIISLPTLLVSQNHSYKIRLWW